MERNDQNRKIPVTVLGATGAVGQRFIQLLQDHPIFEIVSLAGSDRSAGRRYGDVCQWLLGDEIPASVAEMVVKPLEPGLPGKLAFSALPTSVALDVEPQLAQAGYYVFSNASAYRQAEDVPLLIPEINSEQVYLVEKQQRDRSWQGFIVTNTNCTVTGIAIPLKPLDDSFGVDKVLAVSMQAVSGAGYPGVPSLDIMDNVLPFIDGEEGKVEKEARVLLGKVIDGKKVEAGFLISVHCNRVAVLDGHTVSLSIGLKQKASMQEIIRVLSEFRGPEGVRHLPSAPEQPIIVRAEADRPQPRRDRMAGMGMSVSVGRIRPCNLLDVRLTSVSHNTIRGAAGGSILNAELCVSRGLIK